jgi:hypothetical protein
MGMGEGNGRDEQLAFFFSVMIALGVGILLGLFFGWAFL